MAVVSVLVLRLGGLSAAALACLTALILWASGSLSSAALNQLTHAIADALVLELLVGVVIFLGLLFVEVSSRTGGLVKIGDIVRTLKLPTPRAVILIALGVGVTLESLTGYGVSMFVTIPLLLQLMDRTKVIGLALIGMSLMTWGALSVATLLGAAIANIPLQDLAGTILFISGPIAAVLPVLCILLVNQRSVGDYVFAIATGCGLVLGIALTTRWIGVEVAGVGGGLAVIVISVLMAPTRIGLAQVLCNRALLPYALLIIAVAVQKFVVPQLNDWGFAPVIDTSRVAFDVLASPGIALGGVSLLCLLLVRFGLNGVAQDSTSEIAMWPLMRRVAARSWRALASIFFFLLSARLLVEIGGDTSLAQFLSQLGQYPAAAAIALLGGFGAYASGSGVASNALFMPGAVATGHSFDASVVFAALQHSGASHFAMASLPIVAILLAALPNRVSGDERIAVTTGLKLAILWITIVIASGWVQLWIRS